MHNNKLHQSAGVITREENFSIAPNTPTLQVMSSLKHAQAHPLTHELVHKWYCSAVISPSDVLELVLHNYEYILMENELYLCKHTMLHV